MAQYQRAFFRGGVPACKLRISGKMEWEDRKDAGYGGGQCDGHAGLVGGIFGTGNLVFSVAGEKILRLEEYWSDDGAPPEWRRKMQIGQKITEDGNGVKDILERDLAGEPVSIDENIIAVGSPAGVIKPVPKE